MSSMYSTIIMLWGDAMRVSTKGRYGLRAMVDLAIYSSEAPVSISSIADRQELSQGYLEQVFSVLRKAGLVKSIKGAQGGYILGDDSSNITVGVILRILEGDLNVVNEREDDITNGNSIAYCMRTMVWEKMNESLNQIADSVTLNDIVVEYKKLNNSLAQMYYI